jgi:hypothetical protein
MTVRSVTQKTKSKKSVGSRGAPTFGTSKPLAAKHAVSTTTEFAGLLR